MEIKYYTPTSQEEVISWIFSEAWIRGVTTDPDKNIKIVFDKEQISTNLVWLINLLNSQNIEKDSKGNVLKTSINLKYLRIKCLDKKDIESLGFKCDEQASCEDRYNFETKSHPIFGITLYDTDNVVIYRYSEGREFILFSGIIKNISELKKVLTMLNIEYNENTKRV